MRADAALVVLGFYAFLWAPASQGYAQVEEGGLSKQMVLAIEHFDKGEDLEAMDRFMDIIVEGNPEERPMANEYLNLITQRMAVGGNFSFGRPAGATVIEGKGLRRRPEVAVEGEAPPQVSGGYQGLSRADREVMQKEIEAKVHNMARLAIGRIQKYEDIRVLMATSIAPRAIAIPTDLIFARGVQFKKESARILDALTELVFSLGAAQLVLLPEGEVTGEARILDMRRTMAISAQLFKAGVAPPRVRVNLLNSQVDIPREFENFKGVVALFVYNQPLILATESTVGERGGPPASLGVFPSQLDPDQGEGVIIELSVVEPPAGLMSWRFQLLGPDVKAAAIQDLKGSGPVFHQVYWNGRRNYFGENLPAGRYRGILKATDLHNRTRSISAWITLRGPVLAAAAKTVKRKKPGISRQKSRRPSYVEIKKAPHRRRLMARKPAEPQEPQEASPEAAKAPPPEQGAAPTPAEPVSASTPAASAPPAASQTAAPTSSPRQGAVNYPINFVKDKADMTPEGESNLNRLIDTMGYYPLDKVRLEGYAYSGEPNAAALAKQRVDVVFKALAQRKDPKQIQAQSHVVDTDVHKVESYIVPGGE